MKQLFKSISQYSFILWNNITTDTNANSF